MQFNLKLMIANVREAFRNKTLFHPDDWVDWMFLAALVIGASYYTVVEGL
jgi:hypothetical protein